MEVNGLSAGLFSGTSLTRKSAAMVSAAAKTAGPEAGVRKAERARHDCDCGPARGRALGIFKQELKARMFASVGMTFAARTPVYEAIRDELSPQKVAEEAVAAAGRLLARSPDVSREALRTIRNDVAGAAETAAATVGGDPELDQALGSVEEGLDSLEPLAARNLESSARVLSAETRLRERSTIRIRTQEGDIVKLDLRRIEQLAIEDSALVNGDGLAASTSIDYSSRSRLRFSVDGELNEAELAAIEGVFGQAQVIAGEFFDGDFAAAFEAASALQYDGEQLARVRLRFRSSEVTNLSVAEMSRQPAAPRPAEAGGLGPRAASAEPAAPAETAPLREDVPVSAAVPKPVPKAAPVSGRDAAADMPAIEPPAQAATDFDSVFAKLDEFLNMLGDFLRSVAEGFEAESDGKSYRFHYSESFKLEILKSVISVSAPPEAADAAETATALIDSAIEADETSA